MLARLDRVLHLAQRKRYAVGAFNTSNLEITQAVISTAERLHSPVIVNVSEKAIAYAGLSNLSVLIRTMAQRTKVPVVLNLDHGRSVASVRAALAAGFTGVMLDASRQPYPVNVRWTQKVVSMAAGFEAGVEGELGVVAYPSEAPTETDPGQAEDFVRRTGIDAFAVGIGNTHGLPRPHERLNFDRLRAIHDRVRVPLVLHGASGTKSVDIRHAIRYGVAKINIDTDLREAFVTALRQRLAERRHDFDPRIFLGAARDAVARVVARKMRTFGSIHRA